MFTRSIGSLSVRKSLSCPESQNAGALVHSLNDEILASRRKLYKCSCALEMEMSLLCACGGLVVGLWCVLRVACYVLCVVEWVVVWVVVLLCGLWLPVRVSRLLLSFVRACLNFSPRSHSEHWAEITLCQHHLRPSKKTHNTETWKGRCPRAVSSVS